MIQHNVMSQLITKYGELMKYKLIHKLNKFNF